MTATMTNVSYLAFILSRCKYSYTRHEYYWRRIGTCTKRADWQDCLGEPDVGSPENVKLGEGMK